MHETSSSMWGDIISIEVVKGGFILTYPVKVEAGLSQAREVFPSVRKLNQKLKEVLEALSFVPADAE